MPGVSGREIAAAFGKFAANSWGVAVAVSKGIYLLNDGGLKLDVSMIEDRALGQVFLRAAEPGNAPAQNLTLEMRARYDDQSYILTALAMGSPAAVAVATSTAVGVGWTHVIDMAPSVDGLGITFAMDKKLFVEELTSAKVTGFELEQAENGAMVERVKLLGTKVTNISSTNINSTVWSSTFPALVNRILQPHGVFRMNLNSAGALASTDAVPAEAIKLTFDRPQDAPFIYGQDYIAEPADHQYTDIRIAVTYPRMTTITANSLHGALKNGTGMKADWTFLGAYINSTDRYTRLYQWPLLQLAGEGSFVLAATDANQVKPTATFVARMATTSPTGMAIVNPMRITRVQVNSAAPW